VSAGGFSDRRRGRGGHGGGHEGGDERWLVSFADMTTLLFAVFVVLFAISAVNTSKYESLQDSLRAAFSGEVTSGNKVMPGGRSVMAGSGASIQGIQTAQPMLPREQSFDVFSSPFQPKTRAQAEEQESLREVQRKIEEFARARHLTEKIHTTLDERGLIIRLASDGLLFDSGAAHLRAAALPLLERAARVLAGARIDNPVRVEGNTDSVPIHTAQFPSNWDLSAARASAVLQALLHGGLPPARLSVAGYADQHPVAPNTSAAGRSANRRVDLVVLRKETAPQGDAPTP
jgi:chemotaxis protein MotB